MERTSPRQVLGNEFTPRGPRALGPTTPQVPHPSNDKTPHPPWPCWVGFSQQIVDLVKEFLKSMKPWENARDCIDSSLGLQTRPSVHPSVVLGKTQHPPRTGQPLLRQNHWALSLTFGEYVAALPGESPRDKLLVSHGF